MGYVGKLEMGRISIFGKINGSQIHSPINLSLRTLLPEDATVHVLIDVDHGIWRSDLVRELFLNFEADIILSIPLSTRMPRDKVVWVATPNSKFTVKSAYWLALDMNIAENESTSGPSGQQLWRSFGVLMFPIK